ncbi:MAG: orotate phosphoribosyltransferase [Actinomycetota bacterium]
MSDIRDAVKELVIDRGLQKREAPFQLSSGEWSSDYIDGKRALSRGADLGLVARAVVECAQREGVEFEVVGGMTMGADALAHAVAITSGTAWFTVRKERKQHGKQDLIEGGEIKGRSILLLDDVVTTGASILQSLDAIQEAGGQVVLAVCLVDRSGRAAERLAERDIRFFPLLTYRDLGIAPVGSGRVLT